MKEKMLTHSVVEAVYTVLGKRQVKAVDEDLRSMSGIEYTIADDLSNAYKSSVLNTYENVLIYKRDELQCIAVFPRSLNLIYNNI